LLKGEQTLHDKGLGPFEYEGTDMAEVRVGLKTD